MPKRHGACVAIFGLMLYVVNFQILGRLIFEWFQEGPNQTFEVFAHLGCREQRPADATST
jgi:hypothetical protein